MYFLIVLFHSAGVPSLPLNLTAHKYYPMKDNTSWYMITISWLPPSMGSSLHVDIDHYIINISSNSSRAELFITPTVAFLNLRYNNGYSISVEAANCAGRGEKAHLSLIYNELIVQGMYVSRKMASANNPIPKFANTELVAHMN